MATNQSTEPECPQKVEEPECSAVCHAEVKEPETLLQSPHEAKTELQSPHGAETELQSPQEAETQLQSPQEAETLLQSPHGAETLLQSPHGAETLLQSPHGAETVLQSPHGAETLLQSPHEAETELQSPHGAETLLQSPHGAETVLQSPHGAETLLQSPHEAETVLQSSHEASEDHVITQVAHEEQCPTPAVVSTGAENLDLEAPSITTNQVAVSLTDSQQVQQDPHVCQMCDDVSSASVACLECEMELCSNCFKFHEKFPTNKDHTTVKLKMLTDDDQVPCALHSDWAAELFCPAHQQHVCRLCARTTVHSGCGGLQSAIRDVQEKRQVLTQRFSQQLKIKKKLEKQIAASRNLFTDMRQAAKDTFDNLQSRLDKRRFQVQQELAQLEQSVMASTEKLQQLGDAVDSSMAILESSTEESVTRAALVGRVDSLTAALDALEQQIGATKTIRANPQSYMELSSALLQRLQEALDSLEFSVEIVHGEYKKVSLDVALAKIGQDDNSPAEATFQFTVDNVSKLSEALIILSPPCMVRNLPWQIKVMKKNNTKKDDCNYLGYFLQCNTHGYKKTQSWLCSAKVELRVLRQKSKPLTRKVQHVFYCQEKDWGFAQFMPWNELIDPAQGYVKDDKVTLEVHIIAEVPKLHPGVWFDNASLSSLPVPPPTLSPPDGGVSALNQVKASVLFQSPMSSRSQSGKSEGKRESPRKDSKSKRKKSKQKNEH